MNMVMHSLFRTVPWYLRDMILYRRAFGHFPDLVNPKKFSEKIIKRKRTQCFEEHAYSNLADKYKVRNYVCAVIGADYLVPLLEVYADADSLKQDILNINNAVIKPNHGSGMLLFIEDYPTHDQCRHILKQVKKWMSLDFSRISCEYHYRNIGRKILVERMIGTVEDPPVDFKFHIFRQRGETFFVLQVIERQQQQKPVFTTYINNFATAYKGGYALGERERAIAEEALNNSVRLAYNLEYARIDWLVHDHSLYFSEITLTPAAGYVTGFGEDLDLLMGDHWQLPQKL